MSASHSASTYSFPSHKLPIGRYHSSVGIGGDGAAVGDGGGAAALAAASHAHHAAQQPMKKRADASSHSPKLDFTLRQGTSRSGPKLHKHSPSTSSAPGSMSPSRAMAGSGFPSRSPPGLMVPEPVAQVDFYPAGTISGASAPARSKTKTKIKPFLRKLTAQDEVPSLDLSRSATDYDGLGIYGSDGRSASRSAAADVYLVTGGRRGISHHRSTSATSQFSIATTGSAGRQYVHPMRQTPRPFTPPISQSHTTSLLGSEVSGEGTDALVNEEERLRQMIRDASQQRGAIFDAPHPPSSPLRVDTGTSVTRLMADSQTNLSATPSSYHRPRADTISPAGTTSPTSRSSIDMNFKLRRGQSPDPASRAASIQAMRQAFSEREAAKADKADREEFRKVQRTQKREERQRRHSEAKSMRSEKTTTFNEKHGGSLGMAYSTVPPRTSDGDAGNHPDAGSFSRKRTNVSESKGSVKSNWVEFVVWLRTRLLKLRRMMTRRR
ncbi:MAG: hypothetical protein M1816_001472 [Peltula sp. TS41687]|nr:MAG: hypothetical protein M1816_001472 [Peltula sp. TS41687]